VDGQAQKWGVKQQQVGQCLGTIKLKSKMTANRSNRQADPVF
jgi:hypothetical protein